MNLLGLRETAIYGTVTWKQIEDRLYRLAGELQVDVLFFQSNHEGEIVDFFQQQLHDLDGVVLNPAGFSKTGYSILTRWPQSAFPISRCTCPTFLNGAAGMPNQFSSPTLWAT